MIKRLMQFIFTVAALNGYCANSHASFVGLTIRAQAQMAYKQGADMFQEWCTQRFLEMHPDRGLGKDTTTSPPNSVE